MKPSEEAKFCLICGKVPEEPVDCSICHHWTCFNCYKKMQNGLKCPVKCPNPTINVVSQERQLSNHFIPTKCDSCSETLIAKNYSEHNEAHINPWMCFNYQRCKNFAVYGLDISSAQFCSKFCEEVWVVSHKLKKELWSDITANLKLFRNEYEKAGFFPEGLYRRVELDDKEVNFHLGFASAGGFKALNKVEFEFDNGGRRFFQTAYSDKRLLGRGEIYLKLQHNEFFKVGMAKEQKPGTNYCFSDDENGFSYLSCGQMREGSSSYGKVLGQALPKGELNLNIYFDFPNKKFAIKNLNDPNSEDINIKPQNFEFLPDMYFFAIAFKKPEKFALRFVQHKDLE